MSRRRTRVRFAASAALATLALLPACRTDGAEADAPPAVEHLDPEGLHSNPAFSQVVVVRGAHTTVRVGGQNAVDASGAIIGQGDLAAQAEQVCTNLEIALAAGGAGVGDVVQWRVYAVQGHDPRPAFAVFQRRWGELAEPPALSMLFVPALAHPDFLLEIEAIAVVPAP